jgi:hypothetical protein
MRFHLSIVQVVIVIQFAHFLYISMAIRWVDVSLFEISPLGGHQMVCSSMLKIYIYLVATRSLNVFLFDDIPTWQPLGGLHILEVFLANFVSLDTYFN